MRACFLYAASLTVAMVSGDVVLAQAHADDHGVPHGSARPPGLPGHAHAAAPKSGVADGKQLKQALAPKPAPDASRKQMLDTLFVRLRSAGEQGDAQRIASSI